MPRIKDTPDRRLTHPKDGAEWYDVRKIRAGDLTGLEAVAGNIKISHELLSKLILAWSFDDPVTLAGVSELDIDTYLWLCTELTDLSGIRNEAEKKGSGSGLSRTLDPGAVPSPEPSPISGS